MIRWRAAGGRCVRHQGKSRTAGRSLERRGGEAAATERHMSIRWNVDSDGGMGWGGAL
ncbi:hypothetical protein BD414DRAFT_494219 [Trametes punicea]|nr:hypothetical protein BD414DRAFT_494219 [Trametes punicea]